MQIFKKKDYSQTMEATLIVQKHWESKKNTKDKSKDICNYCKQVSCRAKYCKKKRFDTLYKQKTKEGNVINTQAQAFVLVIFASSNENDTWHINFGTSMHLSSHREWFKY